MNLPRKAALAIGLVGLILAVVGSNWVVNVIRKVFGGAATELCCAIEGVPFTYLSAFVLLCGIAAAFLIVWAFQVRDWLRHRDFERKYGFKMPAEKSDHDNRKESGHGASFHGYDGFDGD